MKRFIQLLSITILSLIITGCNDDDKNPELIFSEVANDAPDVIQFHFYSDDPHCGLPRIARIFSIAAGGNLVIKATNTNTLNLGYLSDPENHFVTCPVDGGSISNDFYNCEEGHWTATITNNNEISFAFNPLSAEEAAAAPYITSYMPVAAIVDGKVVNTKIIVSRISPIND